MPLIPIDYDWKKLRGKQMIEIIERTLEGYRFGDIQHYEDGSEGILLAWTNDDGDEVSTVVMYPDDNEPQFGFRSSDPEYGPPNVPHVLDHPELFVKAGRLRRNVQV